MENEDVARMVKRLVAPGEEAYPEDWLKITLIVSPTGEFYAIGGDNGAMTRLRRRLDPMSYVHERLDYLERVFANQKPEPEQGAVVMGDL